MRENASFLRPKFLWKVAAGLTGNNSSYSGEELPQVGETQAQTAGFGFVFPLCSRQKPLSCLREQDLQRFTMAQNRKTSSHPTGF